MAGIARKIVSKMKEQTFMDAFLDKDRMKTLLQEIPVKIVLNDDPGLIEAARFTSFKRHSECNSHDPSGRSSGNFVYQRPILIHCSTAEHLPISGNINASTSFEDDLASRSLATRRAVSSHSAAKAFHSSNDG